MEVLHGLDAVRDGHRGAVLTIGNFDGVHVGHQKIVRAVMEEARRLQGAPTMAITFEPHPVRVLAPERGLKLLTTAEDKARLLGHYGIGHVLFIDFSREFSKLLPDDFIRDVLVQNLRARTVIVGHGYAFGKGKSGTTGLLRRRGRKYGFGVKVVRNVTRYGKVVSSSRIRIVLTNGNVKKAAELLGRPYAIEGTVVPGAGRGARLLGTPTANLATQSELIPRDGVYAVRAAVGGRPYDGVANIGTNPTFDQEALSLEVHLFGYRGGGLRGRRVRVGFIERIREERRFGSAEELKEEIQKDVERARDILSRTKTALL
ncbi:MAG: bifunctional riboflavin kinase/FAD synthetase [Nitrospirota bacterium]|jgi:riboflavin kinase/FMN adenylyltransferase